MLHDTETRRPRGPLAFLLLGLLCACDTTKAPATLEGDRLARSPNIIAEGGLEAGLWYGGEFEDPATAAVEAIPRGAILTHGNVIAANLQAIAAMGLDEGAVHLAALPLFHIAGLGNALATLHAGGANVVMSKFDAAEARSLIVQSHATGDSLGNMRRSFIADLRRIAMEEGLPVPNEDGTWPE